MNDNATSHGIFGTIISATGFIVSMLPEIYRTTSSEGCQTIYPAQWDGFINLVYSEMSRYNQKTIPYLLVKNI
jgi:hypothetical protein